MCLGGGYAGRLCCSGCGSEGGKDTFVPAKAGFALSGRFRAGKVSISFPAGEGTWAKALGLSHPPGSQHLAHGVWVANWGKA